MLALALTACHRAGIASQAEAPDRGVWVDPDSLCSDSSPRSLPPSRVSDTLSLASTAQRVDRRWAWWARRVPGGWAGGPFYLAPRANPPTILLRDPLQKVAALAALDTLLLADKRVLPVTRDTRDTVVAVQARWDLAELYDWLQYIESRFGEARGLGINGWGIDPGRNRLTITIEERVTLSAVIRWLQGLAIPCRLVRVEVVGRHTIG